MARTFPRALSGALRRLPFPYGAPTAPAGVAPPARERRTGADYPTAWARRWPARVARAALVELVMRPGVRLVAEPERRNLDALDGVTGPLIFVANHHSHIDTPLLLTSIPDPWRHSLVVAAAADYFFGSRPAGALSALAIGAIPIERRRVDRRSARHAEDLLAEGWSLLIYPEGGRSPDGWGQEFRGGAAYLAGRARVPVVPVHVAGTGRILGRGTRRLRPSRTQVTFGRPLAIEPSEDARRFAARLERAVGHLADEAATDWWQARRRAVRGETPPLTGPDAPHWRRAWALGGSRRGARRGPVWPRLGRAG